MSDSPSRLMAPLVRAAFDAAARTQADDVEVAAFDGECTRVNVSNGITESIEQRREVGLGIRVWVDRRIGFAFTSAAEPSAVAQAVTTAHELALLAAPDEANQAPGPSSLPAAAPTNTDPALGAFPLARKVQLAHAVEQSARSVSPEVDRVRHAGYRDARETMRVATSRGLDVEVERTRAWLSIEAAARRRDDQRTGAYADWALGADGLDPERVGHTGASRALDLLGARTGPTGRMPVVLDREATGALVDALSGAFSGLRALRRRTVLEGKLDAQIGSRQVTLIDDATLDGAWGATAWDGEGQPTRRIALVEAGRLTSFLHDCYTARRFGVTPTGHARRGGCSSPPGIGVHAVHLLPTGETRLELLARAAGGLFVTELLGLHTVNATTGDFSLGAVGREIRAGGELGGPLDQLAISGSIFSLLSSFVAVADDLEFLVGGPGGATALLAELSVSGG